MPFEPFLRYGPGEGETGTAQTVGFSNNRLQWGDAAAPGWFNQNHPDAKSRFQSGNPYYVNIPGAPAGPYNNGQYRVADWSMWNRNTPTSQWEAWVPPGGFPQQQVSSPGEITDNPFAGGFPTPVPQAAPQGYSARDYPTQVGQGLMLPPQAQGGAETLGAFFNPPITDTGGGATPVDRYLPPAPANPAPNENNLFYSDTYIGGGPNPVPIDSAAMANQPWIDQYQQPAPTNIAPNESMSWSPPDTYFGGGINPTPDVPMIASPNDAYFPPDLPPNLSNIPANIPPNDQNPIATSIAPEPTQSGLSLSGMPNLSIGGDLPNQGYNYYPDGSGGYVVYDQNWNVVNNMPGVGSTPSNEPQTPSTVASGAYPIRQDTGTANQNAPSTAPPVGDTSWTQNPPGSGPLGPEDTGLGGWGQPAGFFNPSNHTSLFDQSSGQNIGAGPLPGSFDQLGSGGGGSIASGIGSPFHNLWAGNQPLSQDTFAQLVGWENYQGNALKGAKWFPGQSPGPIVQGPTAGGNYQNYLSAWNAIQNQPQASTQTDPAGNFSQASHSGTTSSQ